MNLFENHLEVLKKPASEKSRQQKYLKRLNYAFWTRFQKPVGEMTADEMNECMKLGSEYLNWKPHDDQTITLFNHRRGVYSRTVFGNLGLEKRYRGEWMRTYTEGQDS